MNRITFEMPYTELAIKPVFTELVKGDINGDGSMDSTDILYITTMIFGGTSGVNGNDSVNIF